MTKLFAAALVAALISGPAFAKPYYVSPLECKGEIMGDYKKQGIHPDYFKNTVKVSSFRSTRKDGKVVDSNYVDISSSGQWYRGALNVSGKSVSMEGIDAYGGNLELKIVSSGQSGGKAVDHLEGTMGANNSWGYTLTCTATVIDEPKTRDDRK